MSKASRGAYVPGAQGYSLAEAIDGITPTGVSGDDSRDRKKVKCRWKGCPTILSSVNLPGPKSARKSEEQEESEESVVEQAQEPEPKPEPEPPLDQSGIRESAPPEEPPPTAPKKKGKKTKKGHVPSRKISREGLCFPHQQAVNFFEMGLETVEPEFEDDP